MTPFFYSPITRESLNKFGFKPLQNSIHTNGKISLTFKNGIVKIILPYPDQITRLLPECEISDSISFDFIISNYDTLIGVPENIKSRFNVALNS
jgi:hypothetical protein